MAKNHDIGVDITFRSADVQPPLFVAGTFSHPPWTPHAMACVETAGERTFTKKIFAQPGAVIQYKFRAGTGDWWILDETQPSVTDDLGNRNNVLKVAEHSSDGTESPLTPPHSPPTPLLSVVTPDTPAEGPVRFLQQNLAPPSRSDASTPSFVRTTVEVANSAAQIDPEAPEPQLSDKEAGKLGVRRLSATPIAEVANTAAEVADAAEDLDSDTSEDLDASLTVDIGPEFSHELPGEQNANQDEAPLFAYEVAGGYDKAPSESEFLSEPFPVSDFGDQEQPFDPNDPTLERFPSSRGEILQRVRSIGTGLNEDRTSFEGTSPSPIIGPGRKASGSWSGGDPSDDGLLSISPAVTPKPSPKRRPESHGGSVSRDSNSMLDITPPLQCIMEESAADGPQRAAAVENAADPNPRIVVDKVNAPTPSEASLATGPDEDGSTLPEGDSDQQRSGTPASLRNPSTGIENSNGNWFSAFIRLVFVDWLGGFFGRLMGRQSA